MNPVRSSGRLGADGPAPRYKIVVILAGSRTRENIRRVQLGCISPSRTTDGVICRIIVGEKKTKKTGGISYEYCIYTVLSVSNFGSTALSNYNLSVTLGGIVSPLRRSCTRFPFTLLSIVTTMPLNPRASARRTNDSVTRRSFHRNICCIFGPLPPYFITSSMLVQDAWLSISSTFLSDAARAAYKDQRRNKQGAVVSEVCGAIRVRIHARASCNSLARTAVHTFARARARTHAYTICD